MGKTVNKSLSSQSSLSKFSLYIYNSIFFFIFETSTNQNQNVFRRLDAMYNVCTYLQFL